MLVNSHSFSRSVEVAVIDSGIDIGHPCFKGPAGEGQIITESLISAPRGDEDEDGRGTHTAHLVLKVARIAYLGNFSLLACISMGESEQVKEALRDSFDSSMIIFAAASNSGINPRCRSWPI